MLVNLTRKKRIGDQYFGPGVTRIKRLVTCKLCLKKMEGQ